MSAIKDGIYFRMPEDEYLAVERLSKSGIKRLRISPADFWADSWLNPHKEELTPEQEKRRAMAKLIGRAYHCARLEPEKFASVYVRELTAADYANVEGFLSSGREIEAELAARELPKKFKDDAGVLDQAKRLAAAGYDGPIWHLELAKWEEALKPGQVVIPATSYEQILVDMERIRKVPSIHSLLSGGEPEVSVFWTCPETGIPMKARFDYLKADRWVEFKTFENAMGKALNQVITDAIRFNRYHIDAVSYLQAAEMVRAGVLDVVGDATDDELNLITFIQERTEPMDCNFIFQQKSGVPNILDRLFRFYEPTPSDEAIAELEASGASEEHLRRARHFQEVAKSQRSRSLIHDKARMEIAAAKRDFLAYSEIYERGEEWLPFNPSGEISDLDFSTFWLEEAI